MNELSPRDIVDRFVRAAEAGDLEAIDQLLADDVIEDYPQSGERMRGKVNRRAVYENYPGSVPSKNALRIDRVVGGEDHWLITPSQSVMRIIGTGDQYTITGRVRYPNGEVWQGIQIIELRDAKVAKITSYFAEPFEPAAWRARWVESIPSRS